MEVKFIDFQSARFASLATDLVLFLFTSVRVSKIVATFYVYLLDKGQIISKAIFVFLISPKKRTKKI